MRRNLSVLDHFEYIYGTSFPGIGTSKTSYSKSYQQSLAIALAKAHLCWVVPFITTSPHLILFKMVKVALILAAASVAPIVMAAPVAPVQGICFPS